MKTISLLIIGFGPHARRIYYPILKKEEAKFGIKISAIIDLQKQQKVVSNYLHDKQDHTPVYYVKHPHKGRWLNKETEHILNTILNTQHIDGVILSTEPLAHVGYARWALSKNLHILMDKPISTVKNSSTSEISAERIFDDYQFLKTNYLQAKISNPHILFCLMAQRRYHPAFQKMKSLLHEIYEDTNCPVTSTQSFHSDGQWRLPSEIIDIKYHSYNDGYGKCSHTGYHSLDILPWLLETTDCIQKRIDNVDIFTNFVRPNDFITQFNYDNYRNIFPDFDKYNTYSEKQFASISNRYGEIDAFNTFAFKQKDKTITLSSLNFVHNGFSQRGWLEPKVDLYKGNGRVRHESHFIEQGPFQAISFLSYQSTEIDPTKKTNLYEIGNEYHLDLHIFRNHKLNPKWRNYEKISIKDLHTQTISGYSRGHQEDARRNCILEFISNIRNKKNNSLSDFLDHEKGTKLLAGIYMSASKRFNNKNPLVNITF